MDDDMTHYLVTTRKGNQYRVPSRGAAARTAEARDGVSVEEVDVSRPQEMGYMFKPAGTLKWREWPDWS
jgi:hypothetical protein